MKIQSVVEQRGAVQFPDFTGERVYMAPFFKKAGLPPTLSRWQGTVDAMLDGVDSEQPIYLMVDQSFVRSGLTQRRPGVHIDGYWNPSVGHGAHRSISAHGYTPPGHHSEPPSKEGNHVWADSSFSSKEAIILASDVGAAVGYRGMFENAIGDGGNASLIDLSDMTRVALSENFVWTGNVAMLHESTPVVVDCFRTLVRLNVPGWSPAN